MNRGRQVILEAGLQAVVILAPFAFGLVYPWGAMTAAGILFLTAAFHPECFEGIFSLPRFFPLIAVLLLFHISLQICFTSLQTHATAYGLLKWLAAAVFFLLVLRLPQKTGVTRLLFTLILMGLAVSVYGLYELKTGREQVLWQVKESYRGFVTGTYLNRNHLAGFLELCLGIQLGFLMRACERKRVSEAVFLAITAAIVIAAFLQTGSRMGAGSFFVSLFFCSFFLRGAAQKKSVFAGLLAAAAAIFILPAGNALLARLDLSGGLKNFDGGRGILWQNALAMLKDHGVLGSGLGTFEWIFPSYQSGKFLLGLDHAHQDYLELAIELGIPAFLLLTVSFLVFMKQIFSRLSFMDSEFRPLAWGALVSVISLGLHGLADFNFAIPANTFLFMMILAAAWRLQQEEVHG